MIIGRILPSLEARLSQPRLSIWRTLYFNFRALPFCKAVKLPVFIYGKVRLFILSGKVEINGFVSRGMIKIGMNTESFSLFDHSGFVQINANSKLVFEGKAKIGINCKVRAVQSIITFGKNVFLGTGVRIIGNGSYIKIGQGTRIAFDTVVMNSGFHYVYNGNKQGYCRAERPIEIGEFNWIGNRSTISSGTRTAPFTIVCSGGLTNKDYTSITADSRGGYMLAGQPVKLMATNVKRVFSPNTHQKIAEWFAANPGMNFYLTNEIPDNLSDIDTEF